MNIIAKFKAADLSEATVSIKIFEDQEHGLNHVILSLPAGMDIAPDVFRFFQPFDAQRHFNKLCEQLETRGFQEVQRTTR